MSSNSKKKINSNIGNKKTIIHHVKKHGGNVVNHVKKHHRKYLFGIIWWAALIKSMLVILASLGFYGFRIPAFASLDSIVWNTVLDAELETIYESNTGVIVNVGSWAEISIENWLYRINTGDWTNYSGNIYSGDILQLQIQSSSEYETTVTANVKINNVENVFVVTTMAEEIPEYIAYWEVITGATVSSEYISHTGIISNIESWIIIDVENSLYRINTGDRQEESGFVYSWDSIQMKVNSSDDYSTVVTWTLYLDNLANYFVVETEEFIADLNPENIAFMEITGANLNTIYQSSIEVILGINTWTNISVENALYRINGGNRTMESGLVYPNDAIQLQLTSANNYDTLTIADLFIWDLQSYFSVRTLIDTGIVETWFVETWTNSYTDNDPIVLPEIESANLNLVENYTGFVWLDNNVEINFVSNKELTGITVSLLDIETDFVYKTGNSYKYSDTLSDLHSEGLLNFVINFADNNGNTGIYLGSWTTIFDKTPAKIVSNSLTGSISGLNMNIVLDEKVSYDLEYQDLSWNTIFSGENNIYLSWYDIFATWFENNSGYLFTLKLYDYADNELMFTGNVFFDWSGFLTEEEIVDNETGSTFGIFIHEVKKFNECRDILEYSSTEFSMNWFEVSLTIPNLESEYYKKFVNLLTLLIVNNIEEKNLSEKQVEFIMNKYENFLIVLKLLKDSDSICEQNLSNYHISQLQFALEKYGIIVNSL